MQNGAACNDLPRVGIQLFMNVVCPASIMLIISLGDPGSVSRTSEGDLEGSLDRPELQA